MNLYRIPWTYLYGKKVRFTEVWADNIAEAVTQAHKAIDVRHRVLVDRIKKRRGLLDAEKLELEE